MTTAVEPFPYIEGIVYGEGSRFHNGRLWFTDGPAAKVYSAGEFGDLTVEARDRPRLGAGLASRRDASGVNTFEAKVHHVGVQGKVVATFYLGDLAWSANDLVVTPDGRAYVDLYRPSGGAIGLFGADGGLRLVATGLALPNGLGFLPDGSARRGGRAFSRSLSKSTAPSGRQVCSPTSAPTGIPTASASTPKERSGSAA